MNYIDEFRKFISGQYLYTGVRLTLAAIIPCIIFQHYGVLAEMIVFPLGTLLIGSIDNPGPPHRRRSTLVIAIATCFLVICLTGFLRQEPIIIFLELLIFGMFFSLIGVYGHRANSIGTIALLVLVFNTDDHLTGGRVLESALIFTAGGLWYFLLYLILNELRPYILIQQLLGENFTMLGKLLAIKSRYYTAKPDFDDLFSQLIHNQVILSENHEHLREILFKTRELFTESTNKSRILMLMFLDSVDLFEQILNSQQDYRRLNQAFGHSRILTLFGTYIKWLAAELQQIGLAVQTGVASRPKHDLDESFHKIEAAYFRLKEQSLAHDNIEDFIMLRQILNSLRDITMRVKKLHRATSFDASLGRQTLPDLEYEGFAPQQDYHPRIFLDSISFKSGHFRHAVRLTLALLIGYLISTLLEVGHSYWILLTIVTILKPAFSITKQRNIYRLAGTFIGAVAGFGILYFLKDPAVLFILMMLSMIFAYSFLKLNYFVATIGITLYVLLSFYFITPEHTSEVLTERVLDTAIGSIISYTIASFVLPLWEHSQINQYIRDALVANRNYFVRVSEVFTGKFLDIGELKKDRAEAIIALSNLSDNFQRMLSEPKKRQIHITEYHQFVATSHMLTSYVASLSSYAQSVGSKHESSEFIPIIEQVDKQFGVAIDVLDAKMMEVRDMVTNPALPRNEKLISLLAIRKKEIAENGNTASENTQILKSLSELATINGLFELIHSLTIDEIKILKKVTGLNDKPE